MDTEKKSNGALIGLVIIVVILLVGGIYMWQSSKSVDAPMDSTTLQETQTGNTETVTAEDTADLDAMDKDLETADTNIDASAINAVN